ncbi:MAG: DUF3486 family protein [Bryobacterales bacterium]|nr:DUF3486 family protein [Bryobacterales bacterium]MDE0296964.1 DUF3486 family protein [Bryobacterales bacterium]
MARRQQRAGEINARRGAGRHGRQGEQGRARPAGHGPAPTGGRKAMHPVSTIDKLPQEVREALEEWLRDRTITQAEATRRANAMLEESGLPQRISQTALNRYAARMTRVGEKMRQSREIAEAWVARFGSAPGGKLAHLVIEMLRTVAFDLTPRLQQGALDKKSLAGIVNAANRICLMAQRLEQSSGINARRERRLKRQAAEEPAARAARENKAGRAITPERLRQIVRDAYGAG